MKLMLKLVSILLCLTALICIFSVTTLAEEPEDTTTAPTSTTTTVPSSVPTSNSTSVPITIPDIPTATLYDSSYGETLLVSVCLGSGSVKELHFKLVTSDGVTLASITNGSLLKGVTLNKGDKFSFRVQNPLKGPGVLANARFKIPKGVTSTVKLVITKWINGSGADVTSSVTYIKRTVSYTPKEEVTTHPQDTQPETITGTVVYLPSDIVPTVSIPDDFANISDNALTATQNTDEDIVNVISTSQTSAEASSQAESKVTLINSHTNIKVIIIVAVILLIVAGSATTVIILSKKKGKQ